MDRDHDHCFADVSGKGDTAEQFHLAQQLVALGRWEQALAPCEAVVQSEPDRSDAYELLGDIQAQLGSWKEAARSYVAAISRKPHCPDLFAKLGDLQRRCGDVAGAAESYRRGAELRRTGAPLVASPEAASAYLELMKGCLTFLLWEASDGSLYEVDVRQPLISIARIVQGIARRRNPRRVGDRRVGRDWPAQALTMIGKLRLDNIQDCVERVLAEDVPGDLLEAGVWRGGATIFMRAILRAYGCTDRRVWVADSFRGLPRPNVERYPADRGFDLSMWRSLAVPADEVRENFRRFQLLDKQVEFLDGWFADTLRSARIERLAVLRLDGDLYESTMDSLSHLYSKLSIGGFVIVDDYYNAPPCRQAVDDFRRQHGIREELAKVDWSAAFWRRCA